METTLFQGDIGLSPNMETTLFQGDIGFPSHSREGSTNTHHNKFPGNNVDFPSHTRVATTSSLNLACAARYLQLEFD
jgi:hypothetical protein